jgi:hypothetical protein
LIFAFAVGALMMAALVAAAVCLHRSFTAVDNYFASHVQQVRIMDYLSRDVLLCSEVGLSALFTLPFGP